MSKGTKFNTNHFLVKMTFFGKSGTGMFFVSMGTKLTQTLADIVILYTGKRFLNAI